MEPEHQAGLGRFLGRIFLKLWRSVCMGAPSGSAWRAGLDYPMRTCFGDCSAFVLSFVLV